MAEEPFEERLIDQLDKNHPRWWIDWATADELRGYINYMNLPGQNQVAAMKGTKINVARRLFHTILHAAIEAGIVEEKGSG